MGNEGQQPSLPGQAEAGKSDHQAYYNWQYDQNEATEIKQHSSADTPPRLHLPDPQSQQPPVYPPSQVPGAPALPWPPQYQQPINDMGTSLGYGQGSEYQYFNAPQPSQPMEVLRQERLQQLQEARMRRSQQHMRPDVTSTIQWRGKSFKLPFSSPARPVTPPMAPRKGPTPPQASSSSVIPPAQMPPPMSLPSRPLSADLAQTHLQPASTPSDDTGMIQRVRIGKATLILTGAFVASRVLGLLRTSMFAFVFGTTVTSDAYLQAFLIPDLIFNIVAGGALSSAFIPIFTKYMVGENDEKSAWHIASSALNLALAIMISLALIAIIFARQLVPLYNPGIHNTAELDLIASLTRIMLLQSVVLGAGVIVNSVLNARGDFRLPAIGTVLYNVGLIVGLLPGMIIGHSNPTLAVYAATWGVVIGALLQVGIQAPGLFKVGMKYTPAFDWKHPGVIQIGRQMVPRIVNAAMLYCSIFVDRTLLLLLVAVVGTAGAINGLITQYYQAWQLVMLPLGVLGMAVSTAAFPTLAENVARGRLDRVRSTILDTLRSILFMSIPSSVGLIILGLPIIQVLLQHGRFDLHSAQFTAVPLAFFAIGLTGLTCVEILTRSFYAMRDSITPVIVSVGQFVFKIALSLLLINVAVFGVQWGMAALALATSTAGLLEAGVMFWLLHQRLGGLQIRTLGQFIARVAFAAGAMGAGLLIVRLILDWLLVTTRDQSMGLPGTFLAIIKLLIELFVGVFIYVRAARYLGIEELGPLKRILDRLKLSWI